MKKQTTSLAKHWNDNKCRSYVGWDRHKSVAGLKPVHGIPTLILKMNISFFFETTNMIECMNNHWMVPYKVNIFYVNSRSKLTGVSP